MMHKMRKPISILLSILMVLSLFAIVPITASAEPTDEPVVDDKYVVAGNDTDLFGEAWKGELEANLMTKNDDGTYSKTYTVDAKKEEVQLKVVKNGTEWIGI